MNPHLRAALISAVCSVSVFAQAKAPGPDSPHFEVAALKPSAPDNPAGGIIRPMPGNQGYIATKMPLRAMMMIAYTIRDSQISGAPAWFGTDLYDMNAKAEKSSTLDELHVMLQNLLAERCKMTFHTEKKEVNGWALVVDKDGPKFKAHDADDLDHPPIRGIGPGKIQGANAELTLLALFLARGLDTPVVDKTGLTGYFDYTLEVIPERVAGPDGQEVPTPPDAKVISTALRNQLGLRLDPIKATADHIVIDHVEKPGDNN